MRRHLLTALLLASPGPVALHAQVATVNVRTVRADSEPVVGTLVRLDSLRVRSDARGVVRLMTPAGMRRIMVSRIGYAPDSIELIIRAGLDTTITFILKEQGTELSRVNVSATRSERRIEDDPVRRRAGRFCTSVRLSSVRSVRRGSL